MAVKRNNLAASCSSTSERQFPLEVHLDPCNTSFSNLQVAFLGIHSAICKPSLTGNVLHSICVHYITQGMERVKGT